MTRTGFFPGSFDPITNGHLDIISRAVKLVDRLVIGVGTHHGKSAFLDQAERVRLIGQETASLTGKSIAEIVIVTFDGLVVDAARDAGAQVLFRGLRDSRDFEHERQMAQMNAAMAESLETIFLAASPDTFFIASSLVKQIAKMGGDISKFVPPGVAAAIAASTSSL